jgi:4-hydroxymandelate oxidase
LAAIADAVGDRTELIVDGGIRRGADVLKPIALGARDVQIGRPIVGGLVVDGEQGVGDVLGLLRDKIDLAMALAGWSFDRRDHVGLAEARIAHDGRTRP